MNTVIKTKRLEITLDEAGRGISAVDLRSEKNILKSRGAPFTALWTERAFIESNIDMLPKNEYLYVAGPLKQTSAVPIPVKSIERDRGVLKAVYENGAEMTFAIEEFDDYFTLEIISPLPSGIYSVTFADMEFEFDRECDITPVVFAFNLRVKPHFYPSPAEAATRSEAFSRLGAEGAKIAVTAVPECELIALERRLALLCSKDEMTVSTSGGPFADSISDRLGSYIIISDIDDRSELDEIAERYKRFGIRQIDIHQGAAYVQGDFSVDPKRYPGGLEDFKENLIEPLKRHGFTMSLHPYSCFVGCNCNAFLTDPNTQSQLMYSEKFTLAEDMSADSLEMICTEDVSRVSAITGFRVTNSLYLLVDNEILVYSKGDGNTLTLTHRGHFGTSAASHKKGAEVRHLSFMFNHFVPEFHSELFYRVARGIARTYNEVGFGMIYLDALDGIPIFDEEWAWYNVASFVLEVLKNCDTPPLLEYATMFPHLWYCRSRIGAWDVPYRDYKHFLNYHAVFNDTKPHAYNLPTLLGWFNFYPPTHGEKFPAKLFPVLHQDDIDNLGSRAIGFDSSMTYQYLDEDYLKKFPQLKANTERFSLYESLRIKKYFPESVKKQLRDITREFALAEENGEYFFEEWHWRRIKKNEVHIEAPFESRDTVFRLEPLYSGEGEGILLLENETETAFEPLLDLGTKQTLKLECEGTGDGESKIRVELIAPEHKECNITAHDFETGFEGKHALISGDSDNSVVKDSFEGIKPNVNAECMYGFDYSQLHRVKIYKKGKLPRSFRLSAVETVPTELVRPAVTVNGEELIFECTLHSGEYLELSGGVALKKDINGNAEAVKYSGNMPVAKIIDAKIETNSPVALTFGFKGDKIV